MACPQTSSHKANPGQKDNDPPPSEVNLEQLSLSTAVNLASENDTFRTELIADRTQHVFHLGLPTEVWSFNGAIPGPVIRMNKGSLLQIQLQNNLEEPLGLGISGLGPMVPQTTCVDDNQRIPPQGTCTFEMRLTESGLFYYFALPQTEENWERGLKGPLLIEDPTRDSSLPEDEFLFIFDDIKLDAQAQINVFDLDNPLDIWENNLNGRLGNALLINGRVSPKIIWDAQRAVLIHLWNLSNARPLRLATSGHTLYQVGASRGSLNGFYPWPEIPLIYVTAELADAGIIEEGVVLGHGDVAGRPSVLSDPDPQKGVFLAAGQRASFVWTPQPIEDNKAFLQWHDSKNGTYHAFLTDGGVVHKVGYGDGWRPPRFLVTTKFTQTQGQTPWTTGTEHTTPTAHEEIDDFHLRITTELNDGGLPEGFQLDIISQPDTFTQDTYRLRIDNFTRTGHTLQIIGATLEILSARQEDGTNNVITAGNLGRTDTLAAVQKQDNNNYATTRALLYITDLESLQIQTTILGRDLQANVVPSNPFQTDGGLP